MGGQTTPPRPFGTGSGRASSPPPPLELVRRRANAPEVARLGADLCRERLALGFRVDLGREEAEQVFAEGLAAGPNVSTTALAVGRMHQCDVGLLCNV